MTEDDQGTDAAPPPSPYPDEEVRSPYPDEEVRSPHPEESPDEAGGQARAVTTDERTAATADNGDAPPTAEATAARTGRWSRSRRDEAREARPKRKAKRPRSVPATVAAPAPPDGWVEEPPPPQPAAPVFERLDDDDVPPWYEDDYYEYEDWGNLPGRSSTFRRVMLFIIGFAAVVLVAGFFVDRWLQGQLDPEGPPGEELVVNVPEGASTNDIARILGDDEVVTNGTVFKYYLQWKGAGNFRAGNYRFQENMAVWEAREVLEGGPEDPGLTFVSIPEGLRLEQMAERVLEQVPDFDPNQLDKAITEARRPEVLGTEPIPSSEGFLFPETYALPVDTIGAEDELIEQMVTQFEVVADEVGLGAGLAEPPLTPYEVLIVASLIEEETAVDSERGKIARVIYNRLILDEPLGIDATVIYAVSLEGRNVTELRASDLEIDSEYNTRLNRGLPPTPISSPGRASIEAALNPETGPWLFYARTDESGEGTHRFTTNLEDHQAAVEICLEKGFCS